VKGATLFVDRDGTLIEQPPDKPVNLLAKVRFMPGVFAALTKLTRLGFRLVMVTNQDGVGAMDLPLGVFDETQQFILDAFSSQDIRFDAILVCPNSRVMGEYVREHPIELSQSAVIGDRDADLEFASHLRMRALKVRRDGSPLETWPYVVQVLIARRAEVTRETKETRILVEVNLDAASPIKAETGIGFFDHMLEALAKHGGFSLDLTCQGDLHIDEHHTVEDCALALGEALRRALGTKHGIGRYGFVLPMDEAQVTVALDLSGRPFAAFSGHFDRETVGALPTELVPHFFRSLSEGLGAAIHVSTKGENAHHMIEACFKGVGRALRDAIRREGAELPSTKGVL